jgi:serine protease AprX
MNKLFTFTFAFVLLIQLSNAQSITYWVLLKDKNATPYSLKHPENYLSAKAIERRDRQHIAITPADFPVNPAYIQGVKNTGVQVFNCSRWFNAITVITDDPKKIKAIRALAFVKEVKQIKSPVTSKASSKFEQTDPVVITPQHDGTKSATPTYDYGASYKQANQIGVTCLHSLGYRGEGMTIAVLDAGFLNANTLHAFDSLFMENRLLGTRDFVTGDTMVFEDYSHGMNVLSSMAANLPGRIIGTAPKAKYWLLRTEDAASESLLEEVNWAVAAEFADSVGVDVINTSLGYSTFDNTADNHTYADMDGNTTIITKAADMAASKGIFVTVSAGNEAGAPWYKITAPADADSILTVGAVDSLGFIGSFSSRGPSFDGRVKPNTVARGVRTVLVNDADEIFKGNGTSFSSPVTAGAVACLWQAHKNKTNMELLQAIQKSASQFATPDSIMGYGIPDFCVASQLLTGIDKYDASDNLLTVYPNPFHNGFNIVYSSAKEETVTIELCDITGRILKSQKQKVIASNSVKLNFTYEKELANGIYLIRLLTPESTLYKKIIKE